MPIIIPDELELRVLGQCAFVPLVCAVCGWETEQKKPSQDDLQAYLHVRSLHEMQQELWFLQRTKALFNRFPHSLHYARVAHLGIKMRDGSDGKPDPEFEAALQEDPELTEWLYRHGFYLPARLGFVIERVHSLEEQLRQYLITRCPSCGQAALVVPESFIEEQIAAQRNPDEVR